MKLILEKFVDGEKFKLEATRIKQVAFWKVGERHSRDNDLTVWWSPRNPRAW